MNAGFMRDLLMLKTVRGSNHIIIQERYIGYPTETGINGMGWKNSVVVDPEVSMKMEIYFILETPICFKKIEDRL